MDSLSSHLNTVLDGAGSCKILPILVPRRQNDLDDDGDWADDGPSSGIQWREGGPPQTRSPAMGTMGKVGEIPLTNLDPAVRRALRCTKDTALRTARVLRTAESKFVRGISPPFPVIPIRHDRIRGTPPSLEVPLPKTTRSASGTTCEYCGVAFFCLLFVFFPSIFFLLF
jgi:hypothetical protein